MSERSSENYTIMHLDDYFLSTTLLNKDESFNIFQLNWLFYSSAFSLFVLFQRRGVICLQYLISHLYNCIGLHALEVAMWENRSKKGSIESSKKSNLAASIIPAASLRHGEWFTLTLPIQVSSNSPIRLSSSCTELNRDRHHARPSNKSELGARWIDVWWPSSSPSAPLREHVKSYRTDRAFNKRCIMFFSLFFFLLLASCVTLRQCMSIYSHFRRASL